MGCIYMYLYIHGSEIMVSLGKFLCLTQFYSTCPGKFWALSFLVFSNLRELIWLSLVARKEMTVASAFLHFPGKKPQSPKHLTSGIQPVFSQLLWVPAQRSTRVRVAGKHNKAVLHRSCQGLDVPSAVPGHSRQSRQLWPRGPTAGVQLWHRHGKHGGKPGCPGRW